MKHYELVERAAKWLAVRCPVVITEMTTAAGETPDAIGFSPHRSILIECKTSMADFRRDAKKPSRRRQQLAGDAPWPQAAVQFWASALGDKRYYAVPHAIADKVDAVLNAEDSVWGLLSPPNDKSIVLRVRREARDNHERNTHWREVAMLVSALRRVGGIRGTSGPQVYVKLYLITKNGGEPRATMGVKP